MKKLFMFLAVAGLATFGASCSSDDGGGTPPKTSQLLAKASPSTVEVNKAVTFSATSDGKAVDGVKFYDGSTELKNPHTFTAKGEYKIVAKKQGFTDSPAITVTVKDVDVPMEPQLVLTATPTAVKVGENVTFVVKEGNNVVSGATITQVGGAAITGNTWNATVAGTFKFKATKAGAKDSAEVTVTVTDNVTPTSNFYKVGNQTFSIVDNDLAVLVNDQNQPILKTAKLTDGTDFWYLTYTIFSNTSNETDFARVDFAAIVLTQPTQIFLPQNAEEIVLMNAYTVANGALGVQLDPDDATATLEFTNWSTTPASQGVPGKVAYTFSSAAFTIDFDGDYNGLFPIKQQAAAKGVTAKKSSAKINGMVVEKSSMKLNFRK